MLLRSALELRYEVTLGAGLLVDALKVTLAADSVLERPVLRSRPCLGALGILLLLLLVGAEAVAAAAAAAFLAAMTEAEGAVGPFALSRAARKLGIFRICLSVGWSKTEFNVSTFSELANGTMEVAAAESSFLSDMFVDKEFLETRGEMVAGDLLLTERLFFVTPATGLILVPPLEMISSVEESAF
jgi:hypothetical protein